MEGRGCLKNSFIRRRKFLLPTRLSNKFLIWDSQPERKENSLLREVKTAPSRLIGGRWIVSPTIFAISSGYKIHYVNIQTGKDVKSYTLPQFPNGFVFLDDYMYVLAGKVIQRFNRDLDQVPILLGEEGTPNAGTQFLVPNISVKAIYGQISITSVGDKIFTRGNEEGALWDKSLKLLKKFEIPEENGFSFEVEGFGETKVALLGLNPKILNTQTGEFENVPFGRREKRNLKSVLIFPGGKIGLVSILEDVRVIIYRNSLFEGYVTEFLLGSNKTRCVPFGDERLLVATQQDSVGIETFYPVHGTECREENRILLNDPLLPVPLLPKEDLQETRRFTKVLVESSPLDRDTAGVIAGFI
jgi:hypothetical protein